MSDVKRWWIHCSGKEVLDAEGRDTYYMRNPLNGWTLVLTQHDHSRIVNKIIQERDEYRALIVRLGGEANDSYTQKLCDEVLAKYEGKV